MHATSSLTRGALLLLALGVALSASAQPGPGRPGPVPRRGGPGAPGGPRAGDRRSGDSATGIAVGHYTCKSQGLGGKGLSFDVTGAGLYRDANGGEGSFSLDEGTSRIEFKGGALASYGAALLAPSRIGLASNGRPPYDLTCNWGGTQ